MILQLAHLNDDARKKYVLNTMGTLYDQGTVFPLYLQDYATGFTSSSKTFEAIRRGWIQQEISYGTLPKAIVKDFVFAAISKKDYGLLGSLIRRRNNAMNFLLDYVLGQARGEFHNLADLADFNEVDNSQEEKYVTEFLGGIVQISADKQDGSSQIVAAITSVLYEIFKKNLKMSTPSPRKGSNTVKELDLLIQEHDIEKHLAPFL